MFVPLGRFSAVSLLEFVDGSLEIFEAMDEWFETPGELQTLEARSDSWVAGEDLLEDFLKRLALDHDGVEGEDFGGIVERFDFPDDDCVPLTFSVLGRLAQVFGDFGLPLEPSSLVFLARVEVLQICSHPDLGTV